MSVTPKKPVTPPSKGRGYNSFVKYSAIWMQILVPILLFAFLGNYLDGKLESSHSYFAALGGLLGVTIGLYLGLKDFIRKNPK